MNERLEKHITKYCREFYNCIYPDQVQSGRCASAMPHITEAAARFYNIALDDVENAVRMRIVFAEKKYEKADQAGQMSIASSAASEAHWLSTVMDIIKTLKK